jgi:GntR family transcriptional repressor for pyruvate dehydrogenase complex
MVSSEATDGLDFTPIVHDTVSLEVSRKLLDYLLSGTLPVGSRLPSERTLAEQLGVGRNAIRDGLRPLMLLGVLEAKPGSGTYVKATTSTLLPQVIEWGLLLGEPRLKDVVESRLYVESALARLTAERRTKSQLAELRRSLGTMRTASVAKHHNKFAQADLLFHRQIGAAAGNDVLMGILHTLRALQEVWIRRVTSARTDLE